MPNCFSLTRKGEKQPEKLVAIDERIAREVFGEEPDPKLWCRDWYNCVGFSLAMGRTFAQLREPDSQGLTWSDDVMRIIDFLDENYTAGAWAEIGRRQ